MTSDSFRNPLFFDIFTVAHVLVCMGLYLLLRILMPHYSPFQVMLFTFVLGVAYEGKDGIRGYIYPKDGANSLSNCLGDVVANGAGILAAAYLKLPCTYASAFFFMGLGGMVLYWGSQARKLDQV